MIRGVISNNRPLVFLTISWDVQVQEVQFLIDTGFTGEIKLPPDKAQELGLQETHVETVGLANRGKVPAIATSANVSMEGTSNSVNVLILEGSAMIGVGLLRKFGYKLTLDPKYNKLELEKQ